MKKIRQLFALVCCLFLFAGAANAQLIIFTMSSVEYTGNRQLVGTPSKAGSKAPGGSYYIYQVHSEWILNHISGSCSYAPTTDLLCDGSVAVSNVSPCDCEGYWDFLYSEWQLDLTYEAYDWVPAGTYDYSASYYSSTTDDVSITVP